jgi:NDP-sugar pyrophosphorylase family protein
MRNKCVTAVKKISKKLDKQIAQSELISIILICDSPGYRMRSCGPIPLIPIKDKKLIDIQISEIKSFFKNFEIILCVGFDSEKVCKYVKTKYDNLNIRIIENQLFHSSNSCESLRLALNNICNKRVLFCSGDLLLNKDAFKAMDYTSSCVLIEQEPSETLEIGLNINKSSIVEHFSFGAKNTWSEIAFFNGKDILESLRRIVAGYESKNRFVFEAINELINENFCITGLFNKKNIIKINNIKTYQNFKGKNNEIINR